MLKAYTVLRPHEGYCQAQAPVAAVLLMHMPAEVRWGALWGAMGRYGALGGSRASWGHWVPLGVYGVQ